MMKPQTVYTNGRHRSRLRNDVRYFQARAKFYLAHQVWNDANATVTSAGVFFSLKTPYTNRVVGVINMPINGVPMSKSNRRLIVGILRECNQGKYGEPK